MESNLKLALQKSIDKSNQLIAGNLDSHEDEDFGDNSESQMVEDAFKTRKESGFSQSQTPGHKTVSKAVTATKLPTF